MHQSCFSLIKIQHIFNKIEFTFLKSQPFSRVNVNRISFGNFSDYKLKFDDIQTVEVSVVDKAGNAQGFASAFKYMCDQLEIPCYYVNGINDSTAEAWNIIYYKGDYYHINVTALFKKPDKYFWSDVEMEQKGYKFDKTNLPKCKNTYKDE